ncbi:MAG: tetratricopeptide repeat protein, partial [Gammaproteobacteria bacterium]|nr:tetratricopeptide repeat protein [Gammaproteobacteria bacterium]
WSNLGTTLRRLERIDDALECFRNAVRLQPRLAEVHTNLGTCLLAAGDMEGAVESYKVAFRLKRAPTLGKPEAERRAQWLADTSDPRFLWTTTAKLRHDIEQFRHLMEIGRLPEQFGGVAGDYEEVLQELQSLPGEKAVITLTSAQREKIASTYNKAVFIAEAPALAQDPVNPNLDAEALQKDYFANAPGITYFDDFLTPEAIESLRRFCQESVFWFDTNRNGYLGAYLSDGFYCDLLFQIAESLRQRLPRIFGERRLRQMWAYKYDSRLSGIERHADAAAVNANFWITPDEANLDPESGGLTVYTRETPMEWDFEKYNRDQVALEEILEGSDSLTIPYRQNRIALFNSNLVHKTDVIRFREGYEYRRINVTMLFGHRGDAPRVS